jgi:hypothetical protein
LRGHKHRVQSRGERLAAALAGCGDRPLADGFGVAGWHAKLVRPKALRSDGHVVPSSWAAALMLPSRSASWKARQPRRGPKGSGWAASPAAAPAQAGPTARRRLSARPGGCRAGGRPAAARPRWRAGGPARPARGAAGRRWDRGRCCREAGCARRAGCRQRCRDRRRSRRRPYREVEAAVADLAAGADGLGLGRLELLAGLGEEPLGVLVAAGGPVQPPLQPVVLDHQQRGNE